MLETLDLYDRKKQLTGQTIRRGDAIPKELFFRSVSVWVINDNEEYLISQRHPNKAYGGYWECTGGLLLSGETSLEGAIREVHEELGLQLDKKYGDVVYSTIREERQDIYDVWIFRYHGENNPPLQLQVNEVSDAKWVTFKQLIKMYDNNKLHPLINYADKLSGWKINKPSRIEE